MELNIHYLTPYSIGGNIGQAYNRACSLISDPEDWIVIRDGDTMFLTPEWGRIVHDVLKEHGRDYQLFGAKTNRLNDYHQKVEGMFGEMDVREHYRVAIQLQEEHGTNVYQTTHDIAGMFMAFKKKTWEDVGGFVEGSPVFDREFTRMLLNRGGKVAVMKGLYLFHAYRIWSDDPVNDTGHLGI